MFHDIEGTVRVTVHGEQVVGAANVPDEVRAEYMQGFATTLPPHLAASFLNEAAARSDEWPLVTRSVNEIYPDAHSWGQQCRCYEPGILHWEWADGSGFPPKRSGDE